MERDFKNRREFVLLPFALREKGPGMRAKPSNLAKCQHSLGIQPVPTISNISYPDLVSHVYK
jgi:ABC-type sulfate transport system permease component